ncbi:MAG: acetyl-CoA carboxylase biotin carboxylase subunit [Thermoplasmata archaeon]|nr:MAG: acetyl-CoA carboxylase biotin carboxylase subunit [Thermoplasmata archaeon]
MLEKVMVANRGEIACRVIRACAELGIPSVAVYSDADKDMPHAKMADEAFHIGPPPVMQSYLVQDRIIEVAKEAGVAGIHPGYGLLAENAEFAERVAREGMAWIGPPADAIRAMGVKTEAREMMESAGVPIIPGITTTVPDANAARFVAEDLGYPVMVKASYGGGGIGMQVVRGPEEMENAFTGSARRAESFFSDGSIYLEKLIVGARHVEIQVLADGHGNTVHLNERECSIQRRHQKVIEEAPSPGVDPELRARMGAVACQAAEAIGYRNAGTVEFLMAPDKSFYFLEMNTRLQVEHPITEMTTGRDIVKEQLAIADGEPISFIQDQVGLDGHAIEMRIYAEDPVRFLPSPGTISALSWPEGEHVRVDTGVEEGVAVTPFYDPLIAKLCVWGDDRQVAIDRALAALEGTTLEGLKNNIPLHQQVLAHPAFRAGELSTSFIDEHITPGS